MVQQISVIIIGGGLGGLFTGAILSKNGVKVTIVEKNSSIGGGLQKLGGGVFLCTPNNVNVEGKISDEKDAPAKGKSKAKEEEDSDEFNW